MASSLAEFVCAHGPLEHRVAMVEVREDVEEALREAKEKLDGGE